MSIWKIGVAIWAKNKAQGHLCILDTCLVCLFIFIFLFIFRDNIFIRLYPEQKRQTISTPIGTNRAYPFVFCFERDFMLSLTNESETDSLRPWA